MDFVPFAFGRLVARMFRELEGADAIFDLPRRGFFLGAPGKDFSVRFHGKPASSPLGPAAGPHTQLAPNLVLAWLGGARILELKTVQVLDELRIPRPCIDMRNVGYNVEWSQELPLEDSLGEYIKASMLIELLKASGRLALEENFGRTIFDMSVGYDLRGIQSERVQRFLSRMKDAGSLIDRFRGEIPASLRRFRELDFSNKISETVTLSTFHGCPPGEIESIAEALMGRLGLSCTIKLNPTLLGETQLRRLFQETLGYTDIRVPSAAFEKDAKWEDVEGMVSRLEAKAKGWGVGFGVKFCNTLVVENRGGYLPGQEQTAYLSGPPLHVLAMQLVKRFRSRFGADLPISFSAGIDRTNFPDAVALGLAPVTVCSDLLRPGGYGRLRGYHEELIKRMDQAGSADIPSFIQQAYGRTTQTPSQAILLNTEAYAEKASRDPRYAKPANVSTPKKVGRRLSLFDCLSCDKCVTVCPNDANFAYVLPRGEIPLGKLSLENGSWRGRSEGTLRIEKAHQIGHFADFCNDCGNCDVFCPEDGGPHLSKPTFFGSWKSWRKNKDRDGFFLKRDDGADTVHGRFGGREFRLFVFAGIAEYSGKGFRVHFNEDADPTASVEGRARCEVDLACFHIMNSLRKAILSTEAVNYVNA